MIVNIKQERKCKEGLIQEYLDATRRTESPEDFHAWMCVGALSCAMMRNVWKDRGHFKLFPSIYLILVAESALQRKSSALGVAENLVRAALPDAPIVSQKITTEGFINYLADRSKTCGTSDAIMISSELATFLGKSNIDPSLIQILTDYYDCPGKREYKTLTRGIEKLDNLCLTMLGCTTPDWLKTSMPEDAVGGGFFSRLIFVTRPNAATIKIACPEDYVNDPVVKQKFENCIHDMRVIHNIHGPYEWTPRAKSIYEDWYERYNEPADAAPNVRGYFGRKCDLIIKLAILFSASFSDERRLTERSINMAINILADNEKHFPTLTDTLGKTESGKKLDRVYYLIRKHGEISHSKLMQHTSHQLDKEELAMVVGTLEEAGMIQKVLRGNAMWYVQVVKEKAKVEEKK